MINISLRTLTMWDFLKNLLGYPRHEEVAPVAPYKVEVPITEVIASPAVTKVIKPAVAAKAKKAVVKAPVPAITAKKKPTATPTK